MNNSEKIQAVINTIGDLDIKSTFDNLNKLLGCMQTLAEVRDDLNNKEGNWDANGNGNTDIK